MSAHARKGKEGKGREGKKTHLGGYVTSNALGRVAPVDMWTTPTRTGPDRKPWKRRLGTSELHVSRCARCGAWQYQGACNTPHENYGQERKAS